MDRQKYKEEYGWQNLSCVPIERKLVGQEGRHLRHNLPSKGEAIEAARRIAKKKRMAANW
jgi:hypothetical protein